MGDVLYVVSFRGRKPSEGGAESLDESLSEMREWRPTTVRQFACGPEIARRRFDELIREGRAMRAVDRVIPFVVSLDQVEYTEFRGEPVTLKTTMIWGYAEDGDESFEGPWADAPESFAPSGHSVGVN